MVTLFRRDSSQNKRVFYSVNSIYCFRLGSILKIDKGTLSTFLHAVQSGYFRNPYHNSMHGADVANSVSFMLQNGFNNIFSHMETACMIISALVHDLGHPGNDSNIKKLLELTSSSNEIRLQ